MMHEDQSYAGGEMRGFPVMWFLSSKSFKNLTNLQEMKS